jgi:DNA-binding transcriptional LysR family regulator
MVGKIDWENQIGRRLRLRDLHIFLTVAQHGSMTKASQQLRVSQPAVSEVIAELERTIGVPLVDRSVRGVELTIYGRELIERSRAVFDELKQGIRNIEFLADPTVGEVRLGCSESVAAVLSPVIQEFSHKYPRISLHVKHVVSPSLELQELRDRHVDFCLARLVSPCTEHDDLAMDIIYDDQMVLTVGAHGKWAKRRTVDIAELVDEPWILTPDGSRNHLVLAEAFRARGLEMPQPRLTTFSVPLRAALAASGDFITAFPRSVLAVYRNRFALMPLPVDLTMPPWAVAVVTLRDRTLPAVARLFIEQVRGALGSLESPANSAKATVSAKARV